MSRSARCVCVLPRSRIGACTRSPRSRAILLSTLVRSIADRVTLWSERPKKKIATRYYRKEGAEERTGVSEA